MELDAIEHMLLPALMTVISSGIVYMILISTFNNYFSRLNSTCNTAENTLKWLEDHLVNIEN